MAARDESLIKLIDDFDAAYGRPPSTSEIIVWRESQASVALDKGDCGTYSLDELGAYTAKSPTPTDPYRAELVVTDPKGESVVICSSEGDDSNTALMDMKNRITRTLAEQ